MTDQKSIWFTYAWDDNKDGDVDFVAQELVRKGLDVKLDRWNLTAGKRLWEQISSFIQDTSKSDGWLIYATQNSLGSEKCKEEYYYALDRALETRGGEYPIIALFPSTIDESIIPQGLKSRLFVSITDPNWKERIIAAIEGREANVSTNLVEPYSLTVHRGGTERDNIVIEVRPRAGTWSPFVAAIPIEEKEKVSPHLIHGPAKRIPKTTILMSYGKGQTSDGKYWHMFAINEATPSQSYYISCKALPSFLIFGVDKEGPQYKVNF